MTTTQTIPSQFRDVRLPPFASVSEALRAACDDAQELAACDHAQPQTGVWYKTRGGRVRFDVPGAVIGRRYRPQNLVYVCDIDFPEPVRGYLEGLASLGHPDVDVARGLTAIHGAVHGPATDDVRAFYERAAAARQPRLQPAAAYDNCLDLTVYLAEITLLADWLDEHRPASLAS